MHLFPKILFCGVLLVECSFADFTIHVLNPWENDTSALRRDSLRMVGNNEVGYYPGTSMTPEGGGWFYYTYKTHLKTDSLNFIIADWIGPGSWRGYVTYSKAFRIDSLFAPFPASVNELWIAIPDTNQQPQIYDHFPGTTKIHSFEQKRFPSSSTRSTVIPGAYSIGYFDCKGRCVQRLESTLCQPLEHIGIIAGNVNFSGRYFIKIVQGKVSRINPISIMK